MRRAFFGHALFWRDLRRKEKGNCNCGGGKSVNLGFSFIQAHLRKDPNIQTCDNKSINSSDNQSKFWWKVSAPHYVTFLPHLEMGGRHISEITEVTILPSPSCRRMSTSNPALLQPPTVPVVSWREGGGVFLVILGNLNCQCSSCVPQMCNVTPENKLLFPSNRQYSILLCEKCRLINW